MDSLVKPGAQEILARTAAMIGRSPAPFVVSFVAFGGTSIAVDLSDPGLEPLNNLIMILTLVAQYQVTQLVLRNEGLHGAPGKAGRVASFVGVGILTGIGIGLATLLLVIPGLFLYARWAMVDPLIIGKGARMKEAMWESWDRSSGNVLQIMLAFGVLLIPWAIAIGAVLASLDTYGREAPVLVIVANLGIYLGMIASWYGAVALYSFNATRDDLGEIFA